MVARASAFRRPARRAYIVLTGYGLAVHTVGSDAPPPALAASLDLAQPEVDTVQMTVSPAFKIVGGTPAKTPALLPPFPHE